MKSNKPFKNTALKQKDKIHKAVINKKFKKNVFLSEQKKEQKKINKLREAKLQKRIIFAIKALFFCTLFGCFSYGLIIISQNKEAIGNYISEHALVDFLSPEVEVPVAIEAEEVEWDQTLWLTTKTLDKKLDREINDPKNFNIYQDIPEEIRKDIPLTTEEFAKYVEIESKKSSFCKYVSNVYSVYYYANSQPLEIELLNKSHKPFNSKEDCMQADYYTADNLYAIYMGIHDTFINTSFKVNPIKIEKINRAKIIQYHQTYNVIYNLPAFLKSSKQISLEKFTTLVSDSYNRKLYCSYATRFINVYNKYMTNVNTTTGKLPCTNEMFDVNIEYTYYKTIFNTIYGVNSSAGGSIKNIALTKLLEAEVPLD